MLDRKSCLQLSLTCLLNWRPLMRQQPPDSVGGPAASSFDQRVVPSMTDSLSRQLQLYLHCVSR
eukprot:499588-Amphidinium_carterae.1